MVLNTENNKTSSTSQLDNIIPVPSVNSIDLQMSRKQNLDSRESDLTIAPATSNYSYFNDEFKSRSKVLAGIIHKWPIISELFSLLFVLMLLWATAYSLIPNYFAPTSSIMHLAFLFVGAQVSGILVTLVHLPDMLGMLFFGVLLTNLKDSLFDDQLSRELQAVFRQLALVNIMLLVGLGLDLVAFKNFFSMIMRLTIIPALAETSVITALAKFLFSMPITWGVLLGLVITAVSPNVIVSVMLDLKKRNLGVDRGIHTIIYGMTGTGDVLAILIFRILLMIILSSESTEKLILTNLMGIGIGIVYGAVFGLILIFIPHHDTEYANAFRFLLITLGGIVAVVGTEAINCPSGGALGCTILAFIAGVGWRHRNVNGKDTKSNSTDKYLQVLWSFFKPISFSLIGIEVKFTGTHPEIFGYGTILILLGVVFRLLFSYISMYGKYLTWRERAYITVCGLPKATIQAALGPLALDAIRENTRTKMEEMEYLDKKSDETYAKIILVASVLAIILTAPLGAVLMIRLAPKWLRRPTENQPSLPMPLEQAVVTEVQDYL